jgi:hypothetical protein
LKTGESNMKNLLIAVTALATLASAPAFAAPQTGTITYTGTVAAACSAVSPTTATIALGALSTGVGAFNASVVNALSGNYGATITCNGAGTTIAMTANQITGSVSVPSGAPAAFANQINYDATLGIVSGGYAQNPASPGVLVTDSTGGLGASQAVGLLMSNISFDLDNAALPSGASVLVAGNYSGSTTITLTPGI